MEIRRKLGNVLLLHLFVIFLTCYWMSCNGRTNCKSMWPKLQMSCVCVSANMLQICGPPPPPPLRLRPPILLAIFDYFDFRPLFTLHFTVKTFFIFLAFLLFFGFCFSGTNHHHHHHHQRPPGNRQGYPGQWLVDSPKGLQLSPDDVTICDFGFRFGPFLRSPPPPDPKRGQ